MLYTALLLSTVDPTPIWDSRQGFPHPGTGRPTGPRAGLNPELTIPPKPPPAPLVSPSPPESPGMNPCFRFSLVPQPTDGSAHQWQDPDNILDSDGSVNKYPRFSRSFKDCLRYRRCSSGCNVLYQGVCECLALPTNATWFSRGL